MTIAFVNSFKGSGTTSAVVTTGAVTDGHVMYAVCVPNSGTPVPPAGWTTLSSNTNDGGKNIILARKVASSEGTTQTFTAAGAGYTEAVIYIFSGEDTTTPEDCASSFNKGTAGTPSWGTITTVTANTMNLLLATETGSGVVLSGFPAGYTLGIAGDFVCNGAYKSVAAIGAISGLTGTSAGGYWGVYSIAIRPAATGPAITSVSSATPREGASLTITGTNFGASQGSGDVKINGVAQTVTSWSDTSIAVTIVLGTNKFGAAYTVVVRDNSLTASNSYAGITGLLPANSGLSYVDIGTPNATSAYRITAVGDLASGDQLEYENKSGTVTVATDGTFTVGPGVSSFSCRLWSTGVGYGTSGLQSTGGLPGDRRFLKMSPNIKLGW